MSHTVTLQQRIQELKKLQADLPKIMEEAARAGTQAAVQAAADATPPKAGTGRGSAYSGTNTLTGALKQHWATDSKTEPMGGGLSGGSQYVTFLKNNQQYASYVNDGHRMDRHFVPGLYVNPDSGLLEYDPAANTGIVVGTKTKYVKGEFMTEKGVEAYRKTVREMLDKAIVEAMKK